MSNTQIVYLICGIGFLLVSVLLVCYLIYRLQHPYSISKIENSNWFLKWIRINIVAIIAIVIVMLLVSVIAFFTLIGTNNSY